MLQSAHGSGRLRTSLQLAGVLLVVSCAASVHASEPSLDPIDKARASKRPAAVAQLIGLLQQGQADPVTDRALALLGELGAREGRDVLILYTHHRRVTARALAYGALGRTRDRTTSAVVARGLRDAAPEVRAASARALAELGAKDATGVLLVALARGVAEAAPAIGSLADAESIAAFSTHLGQVPLAIMLSGYDAFLARKDIDDAAKIGIVLRLEEIGGQAVREFLTDLARRPGIHISPTLARALAASLARLSPRGSGPRPVPSASDARTAP